MLAGLAACAMPPAMESDGVALEGGADSRGPPRGGRAVPVIAALAADPGRLKGMASREVEAAFGRPSFLRHDTPAEVWQYYGQACVLDLFLYDDQGVRTVVYYQVRPATANLAAAACLAELLAGRRAQRLAPL